MKRMGNTVIKVHHGSIVELEVEAIVNGAKGYLWMGSGVAGAIRRSGGVKIQLEVVEKAPIELGDAIATAGGRLKAAHVIQAAVADKDLTADLKKVEKAALSALDCARNLGVRSLAFPALGVGLGGFPISECASVLVRSVFRFLEESPDSFNEVYFTLIEDEAVEAVRAVIDELRN